jgi:hypothetical protein
VRQDLGEMLSGGLVTLENVGVLIYSPSGTKP